MPFKNAIEAITTITKLKETDLKKVKVYGLENDGIYKTEDRIFKIASSRKEFMAAQRLIGRDFKNVVKVYNATECAIVSMFGNVWKSYIIEEERLYRKKNALVFNDLDINSVSLDIHTRVPFYVHLLNGIIELASVGILHEDLHSLNVMTDLNDVPKIIDFGIIKLKKKYEPIKLSVKLEKG